MFDNKAIEQMLYITEATNSNWIADKMLDSLMDDNRNEVRQIYEDAARNGNRFYSLDINKGTASLKVISEDFK